MIQMGVVGFAFAKLGIPPSLGLFLFFLSLAGSGINIPIYEREVEEEIPVLSLFGFRLAGIRKQIIAVNLGGAIITEQLSLYLLMRVPLPIFLIALGINALIAYAFSRPVKGMGVVLPAFIPPIVSALVSLFLLPENPAPLAYASGTLGVLLGADILHLPDLERMGSGVLSIGGAGVFDGIFLVGIIAVLLL